MIESFSTLARAGKSFNESSFDNEEEQNPLQSFANAREPKTVP